MRTRCMQLSVDAARWPDEMLMHLTVDGQEGRPAEARAGLLELKGQGYEVVPCDHHECDERGRCTGKVKD